MKQNLGIIMKAFHSLYHIVTALSGWRRYGLLYLLGATSTLAFAPLYLLPLLIPGLTVLLWCIVTSTSWRSALAAGWWFGFGHFTTGIYWIAIALLTDPDQYAWLIPFAVFGIAAALAVYIALAALATYLMPLQGMTRKMIGFSLSWVIAEMLRTYLFTGFPWNLLGYVWTCSLPMMQLAALTGIWGLSLITVIAASVPATLIAWDHNTATKVSFRPLAAVFLIVTMMGIGGFLRLPAPGTYLPTETTLRIIQANISQDHKWKPELRFNTLQRHLNLSRSSSLSHAQLVIWPESAVPYSLAPDADLIRLLKQAIPADGLLLTGALRELGDKETYQLWNSLFAIRADGIIADIYDKVHLVPFGEYIPFHNLLPVTKITYGVIDFSAGKAPKTLSLGGTIPSVGPLICYEAIFPTNIIDKPNRPGWLLNITNDAWFGMSSAPYQHLQMARMRTVEQGIPLVRAANTGISAIIDAYGHINEMLPLGEAGVLEGKLPSAVSPTFYHYYGNYIILIVISVIGLFLFLTRPSYNSNH